MEEISQQLPAYGNEQKHEPFYDEENIVKQGEVHDAFGNEEYAEIKYKTLKWWQCGLLMICESVSLGVLSLPSAVATLGLVPGVILIVGLGLLATYTGYNIGLMRERYPHIQNLGDAGEILLGPFGRELFGIGQFLFCLFVMGSHILTFRVMMNTITNHGTCSIVFALVGMLISLILSIPRTMKGMTWISFASFVSIFSAVMITMISVGVQEHPGRTIQATVDTNLYTAFQAVSNIVAPQDFKKSLFMLQGFEICLYLTASVVIYYYVGTDVKSPALTSAGPLMKKIAYGIAIPTIVGAGVVNGHIGLKYIYFRLCAKSGLIHQRSFKSIGIWVGLGLVQLWAEWYLLASPQQGEWFASPRKIALTVLNIVVALFGLALCGLGLYASGTAIHDDTNSSSFTCKNTDT
ncbi:hypothetical protein N7468_001129 [Penicillium chermesinum]|uniref:Amino acid transporter transmembrane domain-containing protein n=1 Tax=Penicillium chermesinum TaxID=63820 RepID=A0A9W9PHR6_9EURO|nr:uncharacterized protein N7468_001129 [Penicillium chermesinum]KAJ5246146.1 hypothetical protein N7468_001129 [Penicillium chermesinum]